MSFYLTLENNTVKKLQDLKIGDKVKCEDGTYYPVLNVLVVSSYPLFCRLSNGFTYYIPERVLLKTLHGFKKPELWDILEWSVDLTPQIIGVRNIEKVMFFYDILIDGNMITPEGMVFKYAS
jgi:hypothetical protein